jgi:hypothetical protein
MQSEGKLRLQPVLGHQPKILQPGRNGQYPRVAGEPVQRRPTPQTESRAQGGRGHSAVPQP